MAPRTRHHVVDPGDSLDPASPAPDGFDPARDRIRIVCRHPGERGATSQGGARCGPAPALSAPGAGSVGAIGPSGVRA